MPFVGGLVGRAALVLLVALVSAACRGVLERQYEYDEEIHLSADGSATVYVNGSVQALAALGGPVLDPNPRARFDRAAVRTWFASDGVAVTRISTSRRHGRRFVHVRLAVSDVRRLGGTRAFAAATYALDTSGDLTTYRQRIGRPAGTAPAASPWDGSEVAAFRLHLPSRIHYHNAPSKTVERGNILSWEQRLSDRLTGVPVEIEVRMAPRSILYTTLALFGLMAVAVVITFALILWLVLRTGRRVEV